jgi:phosphatidate cytidylyltransferase
MAPSALRLRIATALVLAPLAIGGVLFLPTPYLALMLAFVVLIAAREWAVLVGLDSPGGVLGYLVLTAGCIALLWFLGGRWWIPLLTVASLFWLGLAIFILRVRQVAPARGVDLPLVPLGLLVLLGPWAAIVQLHSVSPHGHLFVLCLLVLIWVADSLAYLVGRRWGRAKLAPVLSPGKTWVGVYAGVLGAALCGFVLGWLKSLSAGAIAGSVVLCGATAYVSVVGDLFESLLKRRRGLKDSGRLLPGHGGILDRIDSLTAAAPLFTLGILWMETHL